MTTSPTNIRWRLFAILAFGSFASYMLRSNVSMAAPAMMQDLGLTEIQFGWILAAFTAGYAAFQFPGGVFGDSVGPRKALTLIAVLWGITTILTVVIPGPDIASLGVIISALMFVRFLVGATHAPIFPVQNSAISRWFPAGGVGVAPGTVQHGTHTGSRCCSATTTVVDRTVRVATFVPDHCATGLYRRRRLVVVLPRFPRKNIQPSMKLKSP